MKEAWSKFQFQFRVFLTLTKRHILVFSKNWTTVLFTMMVPVVIFIVYIVFLRNMMIDGIKTALPIFDQLVEDQQQKIYALADCWMMAGVLAVSCITVSLNTNYIMVRDKERGANRDFISSPISSRMVMVSYFAFNTIVCFVVNFLVLCLCMIYLAAYGAFMIDFVDFLALVGIILLSTMNAALLTFFVCNFINTESTLSSIVACRRLCHRRLFPGDWRHSEDHRLFPGHLFGLLVPQLFHERPSLPGHRHARFP